MLTHSIQFKTETREELVDITERIRAAAKQIGAQDGLLWVSSPHTTAGMTIQENADPDVQLDILSHLKALVPYQNNFRHQEGNADAHIKAAMMGASVLVPVQDGGLQLGQWQGIYFCEFDGPRSRRIHMHFLKG